MMFASTMLGVRNDSLNRTRYSWQTSTEPTRATAARQRTAIAVAITLFVSYAYFYQAGGWNQNSRFALVRAIVEQGTLRIDDTVSVDGQLITGDLTKHGGHIYSDKAPGLALLAVPLLALTQPFVAEPQSPAGIASLSYIATLFSASLPTILTALIILHLCSRFGATPAAAAFSALVFGLGSPAWCYSTLFYGHALATACLTGAFAAALALKAPSSTRRDWLLAATVGLCGGWATVTEYQTVIPAAMTASLGFWHAAKRGRARALRVTIGISVSAIMCASVLAWYNQTSFGSPLHLGYLNVTGFEGMNQGFFGITRPDYNVMKQLLFGQFRGLFYLSPVLIAAPIGLVLLIRDRHSRLAGLTSAAIAAFYLVLNASYYYWDGGWSYGPRHMAPALPFLSLAVAPLWSKGRTILRLGLLMVTLYGVGHAFIAVSTTAQPPDTYLRPVTQLFWPSFIHGELSTNWQSYLDYLPRDERDHTSHAWNIGEKIGLSGLTSLTPLVSAWCAIGFTWWKLRNRGLAITT